MTFAFLLENIQFMFFRAVRAGGAFLTMIGIIVVSFFWALPQALMAAELSLMMDVNGGAVVWIQRAFGDFVGLSSHTKLKLFLTILI